ncbi:MAG: antirestriction protein [Syntrophus sp. (in: bacteria)]|nr:antirestriction protein [Syntrophus sp. (in: bacteria)]
MLNAKQTLDLVLEKFKEPESLPKAISYMAFPVPNIPVYTWSFLNRLIVLWSGTEDARGYRQWEKVNRHVKKGSHAIAIFAPLIFKKKDEDEFLLKGFKSVPVFRYEDTEGQEVNYGRHLTPNFPLMDRAKEFGLTVNTAPKQGGYWGAYQQSTGEIKLCTPELKVFLHELSHHAHKLVLGELKNGQDWTQEIVAELSAQTLTYMLGVEPERSIGNSYEYIAHYAEQAKLSPASACLHVLSDVEKVLNLIMKGGENGKENPNH